MSLTLATIRREASQSTYPGSVLLRCNTALLLFAAGFHGRNDGIFVADAGLTATCVDHDARRLHDMAAVYPASWEFVVADVFEFVEVCEQRWDVVSVDPSSNLFQGCADRVEELCGLARVAVVLGTGVDTSVVAPDGWEITSRRWRSSFLGGVHWTVLETRG